MAWLMGIEARPFSVASHLAISNLKESHVVQSSAVNRVEV